MRGILPLGLALFWTVFQAAAQVITAPDTSAGRLGAGRITIQTDVDSALVLVDSVKMGVTPLVLGDIQPGFHRLKIVHPDMTNWLTGSIVDSLRLQPGEEKVLRYSFGKRYLVLSVPSGAEIFTGDSLQGTTPFLLSLSGGDSLAPIMLKRPGYDSAQVNFSDARRGVVTVALNKLWSPGQREEESDESEVTQKHGTLPVLVAGAATVGFGAAAAYFKIQADSKNEQYLLSLDPSLHSKTRTYDTAAGICLTLAEVGFGFLTYFLLTE